MPRIRIGAGWFERDYADLWHGFGNPDGWGRKNAILTDWCNQLGRDPAEIERTAPANANEFWWPIANAAKTRKPEGLKQSSSSVRL
jgi:hypothetical protein